MMYRLLRQHGGIIFVLAAFLTGNAVFVASEARFSELIGCKFHQSLCQATETCQDDCLFGQCRSAFQDTRGYCYQLDTDQSKLLRGALLALLADGYAWSHLTTQCVVGSLLLSFRSGIGVTPTMCLPGSGTNTAPGNYGNLVGYYGSDAGLYSDSAGPYDASSYDTDTMYPEKRTLPSDEFVNIHKYWANKKRDWPNEESEEEQDEGEFLSGPPLSYNEEGVVSEDDADISYSQILSNLLQKNGLNLDQPQLDYDYSEPFDPLAGARENSVQQDIVQEVLNSMEEGPLNDGQPLEEIPAEDVFESPGGETLRSSDAELLQDLVQGKASIDDVDEETAGRLYRYVDGMLTLIKTWQNQGEDEADKIFDGDTLKEAEDKRDGSEFEPGRKDNSFNEKPKQQKVQNYNVVDANYGYFKVEQTNITASEAEKFLRAVETTLKLPSQSLKIDEDSESVKDGVVSYYINSPSLAASEIASQAMAHVDEISKQSGGIKVTDAGEGNEISRVSVEDMDGSPKYYILTFVLCGAVAGTVLAVIGIFIMRRHTLAKMKLKAMAAGAGGEDGATKDYQELCRQRMQCKPGGDKPEPIHVSRVVGPQGGNKKSPHSSHSSTSSWCEEPAPTNMDITTGHVVLAYMEDHLHNKDRLAQEWEGLCSYEADPCAATAASESTNMRQNRYSDVLPYDHSRVVLSTSANVNQSDYINASSITDHDPRNPAYIVTQGALPHTVADFWQMVWEQGSVVIVNLTKLTENGVTLCHRYWPEEGSELYHSFEIHLVSEHIWCEDYVVRSFYLRNLQTNETRTVSQFHFLTWPDLGIPASIKAILDFRRKVNKSYRGRSCPVVVQCSDGAGRAGTYCLIDMVLNRMNKGAKEIDIAATLEHIRDQRMQMVKTKEQFEFALACVAEEVTAILKALPQT